MAEQQIVAKWGFPGTPLLPRWFYELLGDKSELISWDGKSITIADLEGTFTAGAKPISKSNEEALSHFVSKRIQTANTDLAQTVLCSWGQLAEQIDSLPVRTRTRNQIKYRLKRLENLNQFHPQAPFSVEDCYAIPNLGVKSVLDLSCVLQFALDHCLLTGPAKQPVADTGAFNSVVAPGELTGHLSADAPSETSDSPLLRWLKDFAGNSSERDLQILVGQVVRKGDGFMTELAGKFDLTRQRVSQIAIASEKSFRKGSKAFVDQLLDTITPQIPPICTPEQITDLISAQCFEHLSPYGKEVELSANEKNCVDILHAIIRSHLKIKMHGEKCLSPDLAELLAELVSILRSSTDDCLLTPRSDLEALVAASGIDIQLLDVLDLVRAVHHGSFVTLSTSRRGLIKALLLEATEPVEIDEITLTAQTTRSRVSSTLSTIESICRVDRTRYWIRDRVSKPYLGIAREIELRISENDGRYDCRDLIREIPQLFGVSPFSVEAYLKSPRFEIHGNTVFLRDPNSIELRDLCAVIDGFDEDTNPFWCFDLNASHFSGYGISGVPPEFAVALGCPIDGLFSIKSLNSQSSKSSATVSCRLKTIS